MPLPDYTVEDMTAAMAGLQPVGKVWPRDPDTANGQAIAAIVPCAVRSWQSVVGLITDAFPATAVQLLPDLEASVGLPDPCAPPDTTIAARQAHVVAKLTQFYGPSIAGLTAYAAALGYTITITEFARARFGRPFGGTFGGNAWSFAWQVDAVGWVISPLKFGIPAFGKPWATWTSSVLVCELTRIRPAHTIIMFETGATLIAPNPQLAISGGVIGTRAPPPPPVPVLTLSAGVISAPQ